jgi:hypothetical protein
VSVVVALAGCGSSSKPGYCTARTNLENSIKGLTNLNPSAGISGLEAQLSKIQTDANALASAAKNDFPSETKAIQTSVNTLQSAVKALPKTPSAGQIATIASDAQAVATAVENFFNSTKSKCG